MTRGGPEGVMPSEISQGKASTACSRLHAGLNKSGRGATRQCGSQGLGETLVKRDSFSVERHTFWGLTYSTATTADNTVVCLKFTPSTDLTYKQHTPK